MAAKADAARLGLTIEHTRHQDEPVAPLRGGLPRLLTIEVTPDEIGPAGVKLDEASRAKLHGMRRGDRKAFAEVVYGAGNAPRTDVDEQLRWFGIAPTEEEEERIVRGETVTFLL